MVRVRVGAPRADAIFDIPDIHVLEVEIDDQQRLVLTIELGQMEDACRARGRPWPSTRVVHEAPCFSRVPC